MPPRRESLRRYALPRHCGAQRFRDVLCRCSAVPNAARRRCAVPSPMRRYDSPNIALPLLRFALPCIACQNAALLLPRVALPYRASPYHCCAVPGRAVPCLCLASKRVAMRCLCFAHLRSVTPRLAPPLLPLSVEGAIWCWHESTSQTQRLHQHCAMRPSTDCRRFCT